MKRKFIIELVLRALLPPFYSFKYFERVCKAKLAINPTDTDALWIWGCLYYMYDRYSEAKQILELLLEITISKGARNRGLRSVLAEIYWKTHRYDMVIDILDSGTLLKKEVTIFYFGDSLMRIKKYAECILHLKRYIRCSKHPTSWLKTYGFMYRGLALWDLGYAYFMIEEYEAALDALRQAKVLMPTEKGLQETIAECLKHITVH
jgi:tetratricopeptide (TPR) repeat protein